MAIGKYGIKGTNFAKKYKSYNVNKLQKSFKVDKPYSTKKFNNKLGSTNINIKQVLASFKNSIILGS